MKYLIQRLYSVVLFCIVTISGFEFIHHDTNAAAKVLSDIHQRCPDITRVYSVGDSVESRPLSVIEFSTHPGKHEVCKSSPYVLYFLCLLSMLYLFLC